MNNHIAALKALDKELDDMIRSSRTGSGPRGHSKYPPIRSGHPVHSAVCAVEKFYPGGDSLPKPEPWITWNELLRLNREQNENEQTYYMAAKLQEWAKRECQRLEAPIGGLTVTEAARATGFQTAQITKACGKGEIEHIGRGRDRRIFRDSLIEWAKGKFRPDGIESDIEVENKFRRIEDA